jgi:hypothetical protein
MNQPSREAMESKLQIYADWDFHEERRLACEADNRAKRSVKCEALKTI